MSPGNKKPAASRDEAFATYVRNEADKIIGEALKVPSEDVGQRAAVLLSLIEIDRLRWPENPPRRDWLLAITLGLSFCIVGGLVLTPAWWEQEVEIDLASTTLGFTLRREQPLWRSLEARWLRVGPTSAIRLEGTTGSMTFRANTGRGATADLSAGTAGTISFLREPLQEKTSVVLRQSGMRDRFALLVSHQQPHELCALLKGPVELAMDDVKPELPLTESSIPEGEAARVCFLFERSERFDFELISSSAQELGGAKKDAVAWLASLYEVPAEQLVFTQMQEFERNKSDGTFSIAQSGILSGKWSNLSLGQARNELLPAEHFTFERSVGVLRWTSLGRSEIGVRFHGYVTGIKSGSASHLSSRMPSLLQWLRANEPWSLLMASGAYVFGLLMALRRWWEGK